MAIRLSMLACLATILVAANVQGGAGATEPVPTAAPGEDWVEPMRKVRARFTGERGTFAHFGDSITISMAFWASLQWDHKHMDPATRAAFDLVKRYMKEACWRKWKGPQYGNQGSMTIRWAHRHVEAWLKALNPECALVMFGTNDLNALAAEEYETKTREVVRRCLENGTVVILSTIPPRHGRDEKCRRFVEVVRGIARDMHVPLCDYYAAVMTRRPDDWDGAAERFQQMAGGTYEVPTLISRDGVHPSNPKQWQGDYSAEGLRHNGFVLRNYVVLHAYARVVRRVFGGADAP